MTIKQQGGIFGRNPTFNDVDVEGTLTVDGNAVPDASTILVDSDIGVTVQLYDAATAKTNVSQTFTALQNFNFAGGGNYVATFQTTSTSTPYTVNVGETSGSAAGYPLFRVGQSYSPYSDYFRVDSQGSVYATGGVHIGGVYPANKLDDYEEGTWTPVVAAGSIAGTGITYSGRYTKIGDTVTLYFQATTTGGVNDLVVASYVGFSGLPFAATTDVTASGYSTTEDIDRALGGEVQINGSTFYLGPCGSGSFTSKISATLTYFTS